MLKSISLTITCIGAAPVLGDRSRAWVSRTSQLQVELRPEGAIPSRMHSSERAGKTNESEDNEIDVL